MTKSKIGGILLAFLAAIALWGYVITVVSPGSQETIEDIPIILRNNENLENRGFIVVSESVPTVDLVLSGNRTDLAKVDRNNISLIVDLSTVLEPGTHKLNFKESFPGSVADGAITIENRHPSQIELKVELLTEKEIPVNLKYSGNVPEEFIADTENVVLDNPTVRIKGPDSVVQKITQAVIPVDLEDRSESFTQTSVYTLCDEEGRPVDAKMVTTNVGEVSIALKIQRFKEIALVFDIIEGGGATLDTSIIEYEPKTIKISGSEAALEVLSEQLVLGTINLGELAEDTEKEFEIQLPGSVTNLSNVETVTLSVRFPELATKTLVVTEFICQNVPKGMEAEIVNKALSITVRGHQELIEEMEAEHCAIVVDFSQAQKGTFTIKASVVMDDLFSTVGAIGSYQVSATLRDARN